VFVFAVVLDVVSCSQHSCIISRLGFINLKLGTLCLMFKRKREPKSYANESIEESLTYLFLTSCVEVETWSDFVDASHSYCS
jgi:hypothetical protein